MVGSKASNPSINVRIGQTPKKGSKGLAVEQTAHETPDSGESHANPGRKEQQNPGKEGK
jgi:hypothetical protein